MTLLKLRKELAIWWINMNNYNKDHLLLLYLHKNRKSIALYFLFVLCFTIVFILSHYPLDSILYCILLCTYITLVFVVVDFIKFTRLYKRLKNAEKTIRIQCDHLPAPNNVIEQKYQELLQILFNNERFAVI